MKLALMVSTVVMAATTMSAVVPDNERLKTAALVLQEMAGAGDTGVPQSLIAKATCAVIIPGVKKAALGVGGQYGRGYALCRQPSSPTGWSAPGGIRIEGGSFGLQIGAAETDVILLVMNDRGMDRLLSSKFTVGADAAVAAGPIGRQAQAQTDATMTAEMLAWSRARGVFAGISLQGSTLRDDSGENKELYGKDLTNRDIVRGTMAAPPAASELVNTLARFK